MRQTFKTGLMKIRCARGKFLSSAALLTAGVLLTGAAAAQAQPPPAADLPLIAQTEPERRAAAREAEIIGDLSKPASRTGQLLNWANETDLREIIQRQEKSAALWHRADNHGKESAAITAAADNFLKLNEPQSSLRAYQSALRAARESADDLQEFRTLSGIGRVFERLNEFQRAIEIRNQARLIADKQRFRALIQVELNVVGNDPERLMIQKNHNLSQKQTLEFQTDAIVLQLKALTLISIAAAHQKLGEPEAAVKNFAAALETARGAQYFGDKTIFRAIASLTDFYIHSNQPERARELLDRELKNYAGSPYFEAQLGKLIARAELAKNRLRWQTATDLTATERQAALRDQAETWTEQARQINTDDWQNSAESSRYIAAYEKAAKLWQAVGDKKQELEATLRIAWAYSASKQFAAALKNYESALILVRAAAEPRQEYVALIAIAGIYQETNELQKSLEYLDRTLIHLRANRFSASPPASMQSGASLAQTTQTSVQPPVYLPFEDYVFGLKGDVYKKLDEPERAAEFYQKKLTAARATSTISPREIAVIVDQIAQTLGGANQPQRAREFVEKELAAALAAQDTALADELRQVLLKLRPNDD